MQRSENVMKINSCIVFHVFIIVVVLVIYRKWCFVVITAFLH